MQPYVMDQQWVRIGDSDSSPLARNVRRTGMVVGQVVDRGSERQYGAEVHGPVGWTEITRPRRLVSDLTLEKLILVEATTGVLSPELRATCVLHASAAFGISERRACQALGQHRSTQRKIRARLSLEAPPVTQCHAADVRSLSTSLSDRRTPPRDSKMRGALDSARGEGAATDPGFVTSTGAMNLVS